MNVVDCPSYSPRMNFPTALARPDDRASLHATEYTSVSLSGSMPGGTERPAAAIDLRYRATMSSLTGRRPSETAAISPSMVDSCAMMFIVRPVDHAVERRDAIVLMLEAGASYTVTYPTMTWVTSAGNVAPTLTAKDTLVFWKVSTTLYGAYMGSYV